MDLFCLFMSVNRIHSQASMPDLWGWLLVLNIKYNNNREVISFKVRGSPKVLQLI